MKSNREIGLEVDTWISEEEMPVHTHLKVIKKNDPDYGLTEDEIRDRNEFIRCYLRKDFELLTMIPEQDKESGFFIGDYGVLDEEYSAVNTVDFHRQMRPFNKYGYAMKKIMERIKYLAIDHSSISDKAGRLEIQRKYERFVQGKFGDYVLFLAKRYKWETDEEERRRLKRKIGRLNYQILKCKKIWERFAAPENWEP
jgi:hypothetical protein